MAWEKWDSVHGESEQISRQKSAAKGACTPVRLSGAVGFFQGQHGQYETTLDTCQCVDFSRRKLPCKHMYRLAMELGLFSNGGIVERDSSAIVIPKNEHEKVLTNLVGIVENYPNDEQLRLKEIICDLTYRNLGVSFSHRFPLLSDISDTGLLILETHYDLFPEHYRKKQLISMIDASGIEVPPTEKTQKAKIQWVCNRIDEFGPILFPNDAIVSMPSGMNAIGKHLYKYLHRKFDDDFIYNAPEDESGNIVLPDDEATKVLNLFGTTPDSF